MIRPGRAAMPTLFCRAATPNGPNGLPGIPPCGLLRNDAGCQAVEYGKTLCAVVHRAGEYRLGGRTITAPEPAIYLLRGGRTEVRSLPPLNGAAD